jgi:hypothetical protein
MIAGRAPGRWRRSHSGLPAEEALAVARGIDDAWQRAKALTEVAQRLPAEDQPGVLGEALIAARGIDDDESRAKALAEVAEPLGSSQISELSMHQWRETARVLAGRRRADCVKDFAAVLPFIQALGGENAVRSLGRSIVLAGAWWP